MAVKIPERQERTSPIPVSGASTSLPTIGTGVAKEAIGLADDIYTREIKKANQVAVQGADLALSGAENDIFYSPEGAMSQKSRNALGIYQPTMEAFDKEVSKISESLTNEEQKLNFNALSAVRRKNASSRLERHISGESQVFDDQTTNGLLKSEQLLISENYDDQEAIDFSIQKQDAIIIDSFARKGVAGEELENALRDNRSNNHKAIIDRMLADGDDKGAEAYFKEHDDVIFDDDKLRSNLSSSVKEGEASRVADDTWEKFKPVEDHDPVELDKMLEYAKKQTKDEDTLKLTVADLTQRANFHNSASAERTTANRSAIWSAHDEGMPLSAIRAMPEYLALSGEERATIRREIVSSINAFSKPDTQRLKDEQEIMREKLSQDITKLRNTDLDQLLREKKINIKGYNSLNKLADPKNSTSAKTALKMLDNAKTKQLFKKGNSKEDKKENLDKWVEATDLLHTYIDNNPEGDYLDYAGRLMEEVNVSYIDSLLLRGEEIREKGRAELRAEAEGLVETKRIVDRATNKVVKEGDVYTNPTTGERIIYRNGKWQRMN